MRLNVVLAACMLALSLPYSVHACKVIGVADGDTLTVLVDGSPVKLRLANVDAPEKGQAFGERSKQSLSDLCFDKDASYLVQDIDRYGRSVAVVSCEGIAVNRAQVERGLAWVYPKYNRDSSMPALEASARLERKGLWVDTAPVPPWELRKDARKRGHGSMEH